MTKALDAAIRAACNTDPIYSKPCRYPDCDCNVWPRGARAALCAALPAEPPEWFGAWWDNGWELSDETEVLSAWRALRAHLLGEDA